MFNKEIDEIYELCKRVFNEVPSAYVVFDTSPNGMYVCGCKNEGSFDGISDEFKWDCFELVSPNSPEESKRESYKKIKAFLLELLIDGKCPNE